MAFTIKKIRCNAAYVEYFWRKAMDGVLPTLDDYYGQHGQTPLTWAGRGLKGFGLHEGDPVDKAQMLRLFACLQDPVTGRPIGRPATVRRLADGTVETRAAVGEWDATATAPKSVSILAALADEPLRRRIVDIWERAGDESLEWMQDNMTYTRRGHGGVRQEHVEGAVIAKAPHWTSRDMDPHLHTHYIISNLALCKDGAWRSLDGAAMLRWTVALSEHHEATFRDMLHNELGIEWAERESRAGASTKSTVLDIAGMPANLIDAFSKRRLSILDRSRRLEDDFRRDHGREPTNAEKAGLADTAWDQTRQPKQDQPPLDQLIRRWRGQVAEHLGMDPDAVVAACIGHQASTTSPAVADNRTAMEALRRLLAQDIHDTGTGRRRGADAGQAGRTTPGERDAIDLLRSRTAANATTFGYASAYAAAQRLTSRIHFTHPHARETFIRSLTDRMLADCETVGPTLYRLTPDMTADPRIAAAFGKAGADQPANQRWFTPELAADERRLDALIASRRHDPDQADDPDERRARARRILTEYDTHAEHPLADDQAEAAAGLLADDHMVAALIGPAGTGKTTTMRAYLHAHQSIHGRGRVIGAAASAIAAAELQDSLRTPANTIAKILHEHRTHSEAARLANLEHTLRHTIDPIRRHRLRADIARQHTRLASMTIPEDGVLIIDEAGMANSRDLAELSRICQPRRTRMLLVGDPMQLDTVGEGGGYLRAVEQRGGVWHITSKWRFRLPDGGVNHEEADASELLRTGRTDADGIPLAIDAYARMGRIHAGTREEMYEEAIGRVWQALRDGRSALLPASDNQAVDDINRTFTLRRQKAGEVEADPARRTPLMDGLDAGEGDLVYTRRNNHDLVASDGQYVKNGQQWTLIHMLDDAAILRRTDHSGATVRISRAWLQANAQLGYAVTVHRCQGQTVDYTHAIITPGATTARSSQYVASTRGQYGNDLWFVLPDETPENLGERNIQRERLIREYEGQGRRYWAYDTPSPDKDHWFDAHDLEPDPMQLARGMFRDIIENDRRGAMAIDQQRAARLMMRQPSRLEDIRRDQVIRIMEPHLARLLDQAHDPLYTRRIRGSAMWETLVDTWSKAHALDPETADRIIGERVREQAPISIPDEKPGILFDMPASADPAAELAGRLRRTILDTEESIRRMSGWDYGTHQPIDQTILDHDPNMASMIAQTDELLASEQTDPANIGDDPETIGRRLGRPPRTRAERRQQRELITAISNHRKTWHITTGPGRSPLGPRPGADAPARRRTEYRVISEMIHQWRNGHDIHHAAHRPAPAATQDAGPSTPADIRIPDWRRSETPQPYQPAAIDADAYRRICETNRKIWRHWTSLAENGWASDYARRRGLDMTVGQTPTGREDTINWAHDNGIGLHDLAEAGLIRKDRDGIWTDLFRDRMAIAVTDDHDNIIGFTARANPATADSRTPKYINTPSTEAYRKEDILHGIGRDETTRLENGAGIIICEGAADRQALQQAADLLAKTPDGGDHIAAAPCGTSLTRRQLAKIRAIQGGTIRKPSFCFDNDPAGRKATYRAWTMLTPRERAHATGIRLGIKAKDPGDYAATGHTTELAAQIATAPPLWQSLIDAATHDGVGQWATEQASAMDTISRDIIDALPEQHRPQAERYARERIHHIARRDHARQDLYAPHTAGVDHSETPAAQTATTPSIR